MKLKFALPLIFSGVLAFNSTFAGNFNVILAAEVCEQIAVEIFVFLKQNPELNPFCTEAATNAANSLQNAGEKMNQGNLEEALLHMFLTGKKLGSIQGEYQSCFILYPLVESFITIVKTLEKDLVDEMNKRTKPSPALSLF